MDPKHFLTLLDFKPEQLHRLIDEAIALKARLASGADNERLKGKTLAMVFEKSSTRTRVSFEAGMAQFGGHAIFLSPRDTQLGRGEPIADTARVLSGMVDAIMVRTDAHEKIVEFAENASVPVINGLTDLVHPCQLLADMMTWHELRGSIQGRKVAWIGDGNNMCHSYINAAQQWDFELRIACPEGYDPDPQVLAAAEGRCTVVRDPAEATDGVDLVSTDVWTSMGQEEENQQRRAAFEGFQVNAKVMSAAADDALFMHCLPAHREEEVSAEVIDGPQSVVWQQAGNRLHGQKALLTVLVDQQT